MTALISAFFFLFFLSGTVGELSAATLRTVHACVVSLHELSEETAPSPDLPAWRHSHGSIAKRRPDTPLPAPPHWGGSVSSDAAREGGSFAAAFLPPHPVSRYQLFKVYRI